MPMPEEDMYIAEEDMYIADDVEDSGCYGIWSVDDHGVGFACDQTKMEKMERSEESTPLLTLKKSASLIELVERTLLRPSRSNSTPNSTPTQMDDNNYKKPTKSSPEDYGSQPMSEKLKASNFPALLLKIGEWERVSRNEGDLVAKCYYAKKKLVWEILEGSLKSKIEIQWSDIGGIRAPTVAEDEPGVLEIELNQPPSFFRETNPQPRKHTLWHQASDFTGGQALAYRMHYVRFAPGTLDKHYEKLLQCCPKLFTLSQTSFPTLHSFYFPSLQSPTTSYPPSSDFVLEGYGSQYLHGGLDSYQSPMPHWTQSQQSTFSPSPASAAATMATMAAMENGTAPYWGETLMSGDQFSNDIVTTQHRHHHANTIGLPYEGMIAAARVPNSTTSTTNNVGGSLSYIENHLFSDNHENVAAQPPPPMMTTTTRSSIHPLLEQLQQQYWEEEQEEEVPMNWDWDYNTEALLMQQPYNSSATMSAPTPPYQYQCPYPLHTYNP